MPEPAASSASKNLAPSTPERSLGSSQPSVDGAYMDDLVVLESSPGRPGTSKLSRTNPVQTSLRTAPRAATSTRLNSFFFRGGGPSTAAMLTESISIPDSPPELGSPVDEAAVDLVKMGISSNDRPASFGSLVNQYKWKGAEGSSFGSSSSNQRKRAYPDDSTESAVLQERGKRATPVTVISDQSSAIGDSDSDNGSAIRPGRRGRLQRGSRPVVVPDSPPSLPPAAAPSAPAGGQRRNLLSRRPPVMVDSGSDEDSGDDTAAGGYFERKFADIDPHLMQLFNRSSKDELMEKTGATEAEAQLVLGLRPFADVDAIEQTLRRTKGVRLAIFNQVRDTLLGHAEVEEVIGQCAGIFAKLKATMEAAGVHTDATTSAVSIAKGVELRQPAMVSPQFALKHYQLEGVEWLSCLRDAGASGILADEMGLGKTFQVIAFICRGIQDARVKGPTMVVCPSSTLDNWLNECAKFAPSLRVVAYYGSQPERLALQAQLEDESSYDLMVTTYNVATGNKLDRVFLKKRRFHSLILDEGHMVKNCMSSRYKWLMQIRTPFRLLLTGTPLQNNLQELVSLLTFILPQVFSESQPKLSHAFKSKPGAAAAAAAGAGGAGGRRGQSIANSEDGTAVSSAVASGVQTPVTMQSDRDAAAAAVGPVDTQHINQAKTLLRPFVLRRRKCDVLGDLPSKTETIVRLDLTESQRKLYDTIKIPDQSQQQQQQDQEGDGVSMRKHLLELDQMQGLEDAQGGAVAGKRGGKVAADLKSNSSWISSFMDMRKVANHPLLLRSHYDLPKLKTIAKALLREPDYAESQYEYMLEDMEVCSDFELHSICQKYPKTRRYALSDEVLLDSAKVQKLREIVDECRAKGEKLLVFSQFTTMLNVLESVFKIWSIPYCRLDGQTKVEERQEMIDEFNSSSADVLSVFLLSTKAGGFGINLTSANVVVIFDAGNNPSEERQAEDRAHRVGQTKDVRVYKFIGNNTIDEDIWESSQSKLLVEHMFWF
ncbi:DNA-dependent ATPase fun30 [Coemansia sp. Benny D115]|nr:DNA-dependent ATPase fun30 [Coemansia sp. Benny D115]